MDNRRPAGGPQMGGPAGGPPMRGPGGPGGPGPGRGPGMRQPPMRGALKKGAFRKDTAKRLLGYVAKYKLELIVVVVCILVSAAASTGSSMFLGTLIDKYITPLVGSSSPDYMPLLKALLLMALLYLCGIVSSLIYNRTMAKISQSTLKTIRDEMFEHMQTLPIKYFDTNNTGDIMSRFTNDADSLRQMISQSLPQMISSVVTVVFVFSSMLIRSVWLAIAVVLLILLMFKLTGSIVSKSGKYFIEQQRSLGGVNAYIEETMNGQKVVKVFCHENITKKEFDQKNDELTSNATNANRLANILMPIMMNIGNLIYVIIAIAGGLLAVLKIPNLTIVGIGLFTLGGLASFLQLTRSFMMPVNQVSQQLNSIVMALAGAQRIFDLLDEKPETDDGYVTLVNAKNENGVLTESDTRTGLWAWKHPHGDGTVTYTELKGEVVMDMVDFAYEEGKDVLHDISLYAEPGQKVAFVGATGAGKTTITNLINRFYDIADGKIRYDGININKIKKADLRRSLGIVLQDVNLFTGTVMDNIRYGKLDATDEECIAAAKLANAHSFISRLPDGYNTMLSSDGTDLSQGQRQLISIARAAVADPPVMILDEATSSIDTNTEAIVQRGMDRLMKGRTVFVIAHRLSTVQNSDVIMVLDAGRIAERGNHEKLIAEHGQYYRLYTGMLELE